MVHRLWHFTLFYGMNSSHWISYYLLNHHCLQGKAKENKLSGTRPQCFLKILMLVYIPEEEQHASWWPCQKELVWNLVWFLIEEKEATFYCFVGKGKGGNDDSDKLKIRTCHDGTANNTAMLSSSSTANQIIRAHKYL